MTRTRLSSVPHAVCFAALVAGAFAIVGACTSSNNPSAPAPEDGGPSLTNCPNGGVLTPACAACVEATPACASAIPTLDDACQSVLTCACPIGVDVVTCPLTVQCSTAVNNALAGCAPCDTACGIDGGLDAAVEDAGVDVTVADAGADVTIADAGTDSGEDAGPDGNVAPDAAVDAGPLDLSWAQWPMPNSQTGEPNQQSYTDNGDGTVTDDVTGLMWQQTPTLDGGTFPSFLPTDAPTYCAGLSLAGHQDWRLPTEIELESLVDFGTTPPAASINATFFPGAGAGHAFWSVTPWAGQPGNWWVMEYGNGNGNSQDGADAVGIEARCVRGGAAGPFASTPGHAPPGRYTLSGAGTSATVYDTKTLLTWQQTSVGDDGGTFPQLSQTDATTYCSGLALGGTGWRVPTLSEMETLVDFSGSFPTIDPTFFPGTPTQHDGFWTTTLIDPSVPTAGVWQMDFENGQPFTTAQNATNYVRCVK